MIILSNFSPDTTISSTNDVQFTHNVQRNVQFSISEVVGFLVCRTYIRDIHHRVVGFCIESDKKIEEVDIRVSGLRTTPPNVWHIRSSDVSPWTINCPLVSR